MAEPEGKDREKASSSQVEDLRKENARLNEKVEALQDMLERTTDYMDGLRKELAGSKEAIDKQRRYLEESIRFARTIQNGLLPEPRPCSSFSEHFILFRPKERIGGDLPFFFRSHDKTWILMVDCSGHGVAGAMLTMTAHALLKEILEESGAPDRPSELLEELDRRLFIQFGRDVEDGELEHGIDLACVLIPSEAGEMIFAGARRPLFYMSSKEEELEVPGTKRSIGEGHGPSFKDRSLEWAEGASFYVFSDGFPDQFGGAHDKKYKKRSLLDLIRNSRPFDLSEQKRILEDAFQSWKGEEGEQTDDVLVMGFKK